MRIARWEPAEGSVEEGFVIEDRVVPFPDGRTVADVLAAGLAAAGELHERVLRQGPGSGRPLAAVRLLAPLVPAAIRDFVAFEEHVEGVSAGVEGKSDVAPEWYQAPTFYFTNPHTILGPGEPVSPPVTQRLDFELELAVVIGAAPGVGQANLTAAEAAETIFGYTIMNDWSARDLQGREMKVRLGPAKGKDFGMSLGPWIVTADELEPYLDEDGFLAIRAEAYINDERVGEDPSQTWAGPCPSWSPTPPATRASCPATCSDPAPSATAAASASCGAGTDPSPRRRSRRATWCGWWSRASEN